MFRLESSPIPSFNGFQVRCFRQGRTNLAERHLKQTVVIFAPTKGVVGVFLKDAFSSVTESLLATAWCAQGSPQVTLPDNQHLLLFGKLVPIQEIAFAGYDDVWLEGGCVQITAKRQVLPESRRERLEAFVRQQLLDAAQNQVQAFTPYLKRFPRSIQVRALRSRILGQCTRDGDLYLNERLHQWPITVLAETVAHELVHLEHFNHSPAFWRRLSELLPDWLPRSLVHYL